MIQKSHSHLLMVLLFTVLASAKSAGTCLHLKNGIRDSTKELLQLEKLRQELESDFEKHVKEDFTAQSEGMMAQLHRDEAIKIAYAKNRLEKKIQAARASLSTSTEEYCARCAPSASNNISTTEYCAACPKSPSCRKN